jgi:hypothetical protein
MPIQTRSFLDSVFENGDIPVQENFWDAWSSFIHQTEDGLRIQVASDGTKRLAIGENFTATSPLGLKATGDTEKFISFHGPTGAGTWGIAQRVVQNTPGFAIVQATAAGSATRFFIDNSTGKIGIGSTTPRAKVEINETNAGAATKLRILNLAAASVQTGWSLGHVHDDSVGAKNGAFSIFEEGAAATPGTERLTILKGEGYVGIRHLYPETPLHVARNPVEPGAGVALLPNTGIAQFGPIEQSVLFDGNGVQSRSASFPGGGPTPLFAVSTLQLQELGGDVLVHGLTTLPNSSRVIIKDDGSVGIGNGTSTPVEKLQVGGAINIGDSTNTPVAGSIKWNGADFLGYDGTNWVSLTGGLGFWTQPSTDHITYNATNAKVGIGVTNPAYAFDLLDNSEVTTSSIAASIRTTADSTGSSDSDIRLALDLSATGTFSSSLRAKNIGLYVREVSGPVAANVNLAAVFNGNVVVGDIIPTEDMIGVEGRNILAIQNGNVPTTQIGSSTDGGVQLFSVDTAGVSTFNVMNGNGNRISLFRHAPLAHTSLGSTVDVTYGPEEMEVINNLRFRLDEMEAVLQSFGLLG